MYWQIITIMILYRQLSNKGGIIMDNNKIKDIIADIEKYEINGMLSLGTMDKLCEKHNISLLHLMTIARNRNKYKRGVK